MIRAAIYLLAAGAVWLAEGFVFSQFLGLSTGETAAMVVVYVVLWSIAVSALIRSAHRIPGAEDGLARWRLLTAGPMVVAVVGSFVSLPLLLGILAVGRLLT